MENLLLLNQLEKSGRFWSATNGRNEKPILVFLGEEGEKENQVRASFLRESDKYLFYSTCSANRKHRPGEVALVELSINMCRYSTKWHVNDVFSKKQGHLVLSDSRNVNQGDLIFAFSDGYSPKDMEKLHSVAVPLSRDELGLFGGKYSDVANYDYANKKIKVSSLQNGNMFLISEGPEELIEQPVLLNLEGRAFDKDSSIIIKCMKGNIYTADVE